MVYLVPRPQTSLHVGRGSSDVGILFFFFGCAHHQWLSDLKIVSCVQPWSFAHTAQVYRPCRYVTKNLTGSSENKTANAKKKNNAKMSPDSHERRHNQTAFYLSQDFFFIYDAQDLIMYAHSTLDWGLGISLYRFLYWPSVVTWLLGYRLKFL